MKKGKFLMAVALSIFAFAGCAQNDVPLGGTERYIYREFFDEDCAVREDELIFDKSTSRIAINATATSGIIEITITDEMEDGVNEYSFVVNDYLSEEIVVDRKRRKDRWLYKVKKYEDSEGFIKIFFY